MTDLTWTAPRAEDFRRHLRDLASQSYEGTIERADRERVFLTAVDLLAPIVQDVLDTFGTVMLGGTGSIADSGLLRTDDGSVERRWSLSWPGQAAAERRVGDPGPIQPIIIRAFFPPGWTHGHLGGSVVAAWPLQITDADDAARQALIIWAIAEAELHERIYESIRPWNESPSPSVWAHDEDSPEFGLVGAGFMGEFHARAYAALGRLYGDLPVRLKLAAVADVDADTARALAERWGVERWTDDWPSVAGDADLDVIDICTPPSQHRQVALAAIAAGHAVYCEKPVGVSAAETAEMATAAQARGVVTFVGFNYRWIPAISLAHDLIRDGAIGEIVHVRIAKDSDSAADPERENWRFFASEAGGGSLHDVGSHVFDLARRLAGDLEEVSGLTRIVIPERPYKGRSRTVDTDDMWLAHAVFVSGATGSFQGSRVSRGNKADFEVEVTGSLGALRWSQTRMNELSLFQPRPDGLDGFTAIRLGPEHPDHGRFVPVRGHSIGFGDLKTIEASRLAKSLVGLGPGEPTFDDALAVARVIEAVPERRWVSVRPAETRSIRP